MSPENTSLVLQKDTAHAINKDFAWMTMPLLAMACYLYGPRPALVCIIAALTANLCDRLVALLRSTPYDKTENSSLTIALVMCMLLPASVPYSVAIAAVIVAILVGKAAFGGYGSYPFNPAALGYAVAAVSWPEHVFQYPVPFSEMELFGPAQATLVDSAAHTLRAGGVPNISLFNLILGNYAGSMGVTAALILGACVLYLWTRKRITLSAPLGFLVTCAAFAYLMPRLGGVGFAWPWVHVQMRLTSVVYELLSGAVLYGAVFLINEPVTTPKTERARLWYGILMGLVTMLFRYYGTYDLGVCFAVLAVNTVGGTLDRMVAKHTGRKELKHLAE